MSNWVIIFHPQHFVRLGMLVYRDIWSSNIINKAFSWTVSSCLITLTQSIIIYRYEWCPDEVKEAGDTSHEVVSAFVVCHCHTWYLEGIYICYELFHIRAGYVNGYLVLKFEYTKVVYVLHWLSDVYSNTTAELWSVNGRNPTPSPNRSKGGDAEDEGAPRHTNKLADTEKLSTILQDFPCTR